MCFVQIVSQFIFKHEEYNYNNCAILLVANPPYDIPDVTNKKNSLERRKN